MPENQLKYDLLLFGGRVLDPANSIDTVLDIGITDGKIAAMGQLSAQDARKHIDCSGKIVTPGLIDGHVHFYASGHGGLASADEPGCKAGATTVVDGGSSGYLTFPDFRARHLEGTHTDAYCYLHHNPMGQATLPELWDPKRIRVDYARLRETIMENRDRIIGLKDRAVGEFVNAHGVAGLERARQVCSDCGVRYAVHLGLDTNDIAAERELNEFTRQLLRLMEPGDILTHVCTGKRGKIFREDGLFDKDIQDAIDRGVVLDCSSGVLNFSAESFRIGRERGFFPDMIASDNSPWGVRETVKNLGVIMSKLLALGVPLAQLVAMVTANPARAIGMADTKGSLEIGRQADVTVSELQAGEYRFLDHLGGEVLHGNTLFVPRVAIIAGHVHETVNVGGPTMPDA